MSKLLPVLFSLLSLPFVLAAPALAQSGVAKGVDPDASAKSGTSVRNLVVGSDVAIGETVTTGRTGLVQLLFNDSTKLVVGPSSSLVIEDFLVREDNSAGKFAINALSGSFRFVTGTGPKADYEISTPTGTIGVRGTAFDFTITSLMPDFVPQAKLTTALVLFNGKVRLCNLARQCIEVGDSCDFGVFNSGGVLGIDNTRETRSAFRQLFPFVNSQASLLFPFWVSGSVECLNPPPNVGVPPSPLSSGVGAPQTPEGTNPNSTTASTTTIRTTVVPPPPTTTTSGSITP